MYYVNFFSTYAGKDVNTVGDDDDALIRRSDYTKNTLWINQLLGEHKYKDRLSLNWGGSFNKVTGDMPDRITNTLRTPDNGNTYVVNNGKITCKRLASVGEGGGCGPG